ncbi:CoF synthetase [Winogradskyella sp. UBA3174]|uniref:CoF synthetase n=1 Tax=Winogradskyella sp. UBA3174 TaxID=1947785 RepID=UPI0025E276F3|nr:CoF synthetase [Winogradskyella sp. UBA3174]|tara:strand:+ start:3695 stop:5008 length:1314 start_codon:yes stop_codon:yes gene_type:complete
MKTIRAKAFWILDFIKGSKIKTHYDDIAFINLNDNIKATKKRREKHINTFLNHATETTPFYNKFKGFKEIENFPVINKNIVKENFNHFKSNICIKKNKNRVATSGSTGVPFFIYQDANKKLRNSADSIYFLNKANYYLGEKLYHFGVYRSLNMNNPIKIWMQNKVYVDVILFDDSHIKALIKRLETNTSPINLLGFASTFESICIYLDKIGSKSLSHIKINSVIANSEYLNSYTKRSMEKYFNTPVVSRYSNAELGLIAQQLPLQGKEEFNINWASYHVEILKMGSDIPAELGVLGRIVITDLFNYSMPMIRYDTGDIGMFENLPTKSNPFPTLKKIEGRKMDSVYDTKGKIISSFVVYFYFYKYYPLLKQHQFIQTGKKEYLIKLNTYTGRFEYEQNLIESIQEDFGKDANVKISLVNEIPSLSSGKRKKVANFYC